MPSWMNDLLNAYLYVRLMYLMYVKQRYNTLPIYEIPYTEHNKPRIVAKQDQSISSLLFDDVYIVTKYYAFAVNRLYDPGT